MNKVVARFADGRMVKGMTADFFPNKDLFHVNTASSVDGGETVEISVKELKALFFVKDLVGNPEHVEAKEFDPGSPPIGRKIKVVFLDGEMLVGTTTGYQAGRPGFFLSPADPTSNIERGYIVAAAAQEISFV